MPCRRPHSCTFVAHAVPALHMRRSWRAAAAQMLITAATSSPPRPTWRRLCSLQGYSPWCPPPLLPRVRRLFLQPASASSAPSRGRSARARRGLREDRNFGSAGAEAATLSGGARDRVAQRLRPPASLRSFVRAPCLPHAVPPPPPCPAQRRSLRRPPRLQARYHTGGGQKQDGEAPKCL